MIKCKFKEGLTWSQHNNKLLGITDMECMHNRGDEEFIASNSLQFFFISLFAEFAHPLTYLCVRNLTGIQVSTVFREDVTLLHRFGLNILATICDGASENRHCIIFFFKS